MAKSTAPRGDTPINSVADQRGGSAATVPASVTADLSIKMDRRRLEQALRAGAPYCKPCKVD